MNFAKLITLTIAFFIKGKRDKLNGTNRAKFAVFRRCSLIFADFRFSWELQHFGGAGFHRKPQETADFRRRPQETADFRRNPFVPCSLSLLIPPFLNLSGIPILIISVRTVSKPQGIHLAIKRNPNANFLVRISSGSSTRGGGGKKLGMSFETQGNQTFWRYIPGCLPGYPGSARKDV